MNETKLQDFMGKLVGDMGGAAIMANVILGDELGLYRAMADGQAVTPDELAARTGCQARLKRITGLLSMRSKPAARAKAAVAAMRRQSGHHPGTERFFRPLYNLVSSWLPAPDGGAALEAGAKVADIGRPWRVDHRDGAAQLSHAFTASTSTRRRSSRRERAPLPASATGSSSARDGARVSR
jgi:hypothetical protein